ncbi:NFYB/HAP3 family transcription factor subunit [Candidatus Micrarchaeota archaeon]|nr:NFYB/HAP3 family transcription factor subunit [Candidatus Micrarchaeota archaeon]
MAELSSVDVEILIRKAGAERVSEEACEKLAEILEERATVILERARRFAIYVGRKRKITKQDIELAVD